MKWAGDRCRLIPRLCIAETGIRFEIAKQIGSAFGDASDDSSE